MVELTNEAIDLEAVLRAVISPQAGANVLFVGTTRQFTNGIETVKLDYDGYRSMAIDELNRLREEAMNRWPIVACSIVHRLGTVDLAEASIAVAVSTPHRVECFESASWIMDELKQRIPIWKREHPVAGQSEWVHPGLTPPQSESR